MTVFDNLTKKKEKRIMMNAPAHKGKTSLPYLKKFSANVDISDLPNSDGEYESIKEAEARAAELWGADSSYIVTGGSAAGMLAAIYAHTVEGTEVLVARNCPKYVYNALEVCRVIPRYIVPDSDKLGFFGSIDPKDVEDALIAYRNVRLVIITSPTAEGVISDVSEISRITKARGIPLIVDEPCGAHLGFSDFFAGNAVSAGADVTVQNLYSTLPSLTQTALIHAGGMCNTEKLKYALDLFSPEKPSFPLICAADACVEYVKNSKERSFEKWRKNIEIFEKKTKKLTNLKIRFSANDKDEHKNVFAFDKSKIIVSTQGTDMTGYGLMKALEESKIKIESAGTYFAVISTGMLDGSGEISRLAKALCNIDKKLRGSIPAKYPDMQDIPEIACTSAEAARHNSESVFAGEAEGSVCAEYIWAYPSFVPFIVPGEIFDANVISRIRNASTLGACVICSDKSLKTFKVIKK